MATKSYLFKVYNPAGTTLLATWNDVASDPTFSQNINSAGSEMDLILARDPTNFGEGADVAHLNRVKIYTVDQEAINGTLLFTGFIDTYTPNFDANNVAVVVMSYGMELDNYMIENVLPTKPFYTMPTPNGYGPTYFFGSTIDAAIYPAYAGDTLDIAQSFIAEGTYITKVNAAIIPLSTGPIDDVTVECQIWSDLNGRPNAKISTGTITNVVHTTDPPLGYTWDFSGAPISVVDGKVYWMVFTAPGGTPNVDVVSWMQTDPNSPNPDPRLKFLIGTSQDSASWRTFYFNIDHSQSNLVFSIWNNAADTTVPYLSMDPSDILRNIITRYNAAGGSITYTQNSIDSTSTLVSYTFNTNTTLEGVNKCLELAPPGWYYYIDQAANVLHFHKKASSPEVTFTLGREIAAFAPEKRVESVINAIYFVGGKIDGVNLFRKYLNQASITSNGRWQQKYSDDRVTITHTADTIANTILSNHAAPEVRGTIDVLDSNGNAYGYDIELQLVGKIIGFRNFGGTGAALWDTALWDTGIWDFSITKIGSYSLQVTRADYTPDKITLTFSTIPPDVNKRIEDINRALEAQAAADNPTQPVG